jgi:hypothetical protein
VFKIGSWGSLSSAVMARRAQHFLSRDLQSTHSKFKITKKLHDSKFPDEMKRENAQNLNRIRMEQA